MAKSWAISGVDLHLELAGPRVRAALETALREAVRSGRLVEGAQLPPSRALAGDLGISRNTVAAAYGQLVAEGWLTARQGSGTRVAARWQADEGRQAPALPLGRPARFDLRAGFPDLASFPRAAWLAALRRSLAVASPEAFGYSDPLGRPELRRALAEYLSRARGVHAAPERIVICSGFAQGLSLLCHALRGAGASTIATEAYGHKRHRDAIAAAGLRLATVRVDARGAVIDELGTADAVVLTPAHQFPLGSALAAERRTQAIDWARETGGLVVEDDYDGEFRFDRQPVGAMQALAPEHVAYAGTASKSLAPGVRLGWLALPERLVAPVVEAKLLTGDPSALEQLALAELLVSGTYDRHVRRARHAYRRRRDALVSALAKRAPEARVSGIVAGLHLLVGLPSGVLEAAVVERARSRGLLVEGLDSYGTGVQQHDPALVVGFGTPPAHAFAGAVRALCASL